MKDELTLQEIHECTLEVLDKINQICDETGIKYVMWYGSLLGAIRHKGFIPWDDDCDIAMLRPDYDRFVAYCRENAQKLHPFRLASKEDGPNYPYNLVRFCDNRYTMVTNDYVTNDMGIFVDIYPLDGIGNNPAKAQRKLGWKKRYYDIATYTALRKRPEKTNGGFIYKAGKRVIYWIAKNKTPMYYFRKYDKLATIYNYEGSKYVSSLTWDVNVHVYPKEWIENTIMWDFEDRRVPIPVNYDEILKDNYRNYMEPPPKEKQITKHEYKIYKKQQS